MANYRTTVILKTDIVDSTPRLAGLTQAEMRMERKQHRQFIAETATQNHGAVFQEEGDAYWIEFPSVTNACLAAIDMHQRLRSQQAGKGDKQRLAIRAVITAGDILHEGNDSIGMTMSLTARIEKITPPDGIYLSHAAWLILNKAEVQTSLVGEFDMKGFNEPEKIFRVDQRHRTRVLTDQFIVFTDIRSWSTYTKSADVMVVEEILTQYDDLMNEVCGAYNGVIRNASGDQYFLTFSHAENLFHAIERLCISWKSTRDRYQLGLSVAIHKGDLNIIRSYLFSNDIHTTYFLESMNKLNHPAKETISVTVSRRIKDAAIGTKWENAFQIADPVKITNALLQSTVDEYGAYLFIVDTK